MQVRAIDGFVVLETAPGHRADTVISFPSKWFFGAEFRVTLIEDLESFMAAIGVFPSDY